MADVKNTQTPENVNVNTNTTPAPAAQAPAAAAEPAKVPWYKKIFNKRNVAKAIQFVSGFGLMVGAGVIGGATAANVMNHNATAQTPASHTDVTSSGGDDGVDIDQF